MPDFLVDTNVLVYALDANSPTKQVRASEWLEYLVASKTGALSSQSLSELSDVCLNRMRPRWHPQDISEHIQALLESFTVFPVTPGVVREALRGVGEHKLSFYDSQMWAVARLRELPNLLSEDLAVGSRIDGITIVNPFATRTPA